MSPNGNPGNQSCAMCLYWNQARGRLHHGDCRKVSPVPAGAYPQLGYQFPVTWHGEWCGSFSWGGKSQAPSRPPVPSEGRDHGWPRSVSPRGLINIEGGPSLFAILASVLLLALFMVIIAYVFGGA